MKNNFFFLSSHKNDFFGYFNKSPIDLNNNFIIFHSSTFKGRMPKKGEMVDIVLYDKKNDKNKIIDSTSSWNWQLGSMLQWLNYKDKIIYNLFDNKKPKTAIYDIFNNTKEIHPYNFIATNNKINSYLSINFNHLNLSRPGYGYDYEDEYNKDFYLIE